MSGDDAEMLNLAVGDVVVYGAHGAGTVEAREIRSVNGDEQAVVESSNRSNQVRCVRCVRAPRDDADHVDWAALDEGAVCPGCLTMLEMEAHRASG